MSVSPPTGAHHALPRRTRAIAARCERKELAVVPLTGETSPDGEGPVSIGPD